MSKHDLTLNAAKVSIETAQYPSNSLVEVELVDVDLNDVIASVGTTEVLDHITNDDIAEYVRENGIVIEED